MSTRPTLHLGDESAAVGPGPTGLLALAALAAFGCGRFASDHMEVKSVTSVLPVTIAY